VLLLFTMTHTQSSHAISNPPPLPPSLPPSLSLSTRWSSPLKAPWLSVFAPEGLVFPHSTPPQPTARWSRKEAFRSSLMQTAAP